MNELFNPQSMTQMGTVPLFMMGEAYDWMGRAKGADAATLAELMAERGRKSQTHVADMAQKGATLEQTLLGNQKTDLDLQKTKALQPKQINNELLKLGVEADENEWKTTLQKINKGVLENNPEALKLYEQLPAIREARLKAKADKDKEELQRRTQIDVANIGAVSREKVADRKTGGTKIPKTPRELLTYYTYMANQMEDGPEKEQMLGLAEAEWRKIQEEAILAAEAARAGKVDPSGLSDGKIPTNPAPTPTPLPKPQAPGASKYTLENPAKPKTQQEYNALPSGSIYIDTDGKTKRKK